MVLLGELVERRGGGGGTERSAWSHQLATVAVQGPAVAQAPFRKECPPTGRKPRGLRDRFPKDPDPRIYPWTSDVEWEGGGREEAGKEWSLGSADSQGGQGERLDRRKASPAPAAPWEHSSLLGQFTALTLPPP